MPPQTPRARGVRENSFSLSRLARLAPSPCRAIWLRGRALSPATESSATPRQTVPKIAGPDADARRAKQSRAASMARRETDCPSAFQAADTTRLQRLIGRQAKPPGQNTGDEEIHERFLRRLCIGSAREFDIAGFLAMRGRTRICLAGTIRGQRGGIASRARAPAGRTFSDLALKRGSHRIDKVALQRVERERPGIDIKPVDRPVLVARRCARKRVIEGRRKPVAAQSGELSLQRKAFRFRPTDGNVEDLTADRVLLRGGRHSLLPNRGQRIILPPSLNLYVHRCRCRAAFRVEPSDRDDLASRRARTRSGMDRLVARVRRPARRLPEEGEAANGHRRSCLEVHRLSSNSRYCFR